MEYTLVFDGTTSSSSSLPSVNSWCILGSYNKEQTRRLLVQILVRNVHRLKFSIPSIALRFNSLTSKIWLSVLLSVTHFLVNQLREFGFILLQVQGSFEHLRVTWNIKTSTCQNSVIALTLDTKPSTEGCTIRKAFWKLSSNVRPIAITW